MKLPSLSRLPKYNRFNFEPRFYDPVKEELENRKTRIANEMQNKYDDDAVKRRISESFIRSRNTRTVEVNFLQIFMVFLIAATFISFIYIGFIALLLSLTIIVSYVLIKKGIFDFLKPTAAKTIDDPFGTRERLSGQMKAGGYFARKSNQKRGFYKLAMLLAMTAVSVAYYMGHLNGIVSVLFIFVLLILFIKESRKA